jgi:hypothetical protein
MFDDLIPGGGTAIPPPTPMDEAPAALPPANMFQDLIPKAQEAQTVPAPDATDEAPLTAPTAPAPPSMFADLIPKKPEDEPAGILSTFGSEAAKQAFALPGQALEAAGIAVGQGGDKPIVQGSIYQVGKQLQQYADTWGATEASKAENPIAAAAGGVVGGTGAAIAPLLAVGAAAGEIPALAAGAIIFGATSAAGTFDEALLKGADENTASKAAGLSALVGGGLGVIPLRTVLAPVGAYSPGLKGWAAAKLEQGLRSGIVFSTVGEAQEFLGRQIAKTFYDPEAGYTPDIQRILGSFIGGGIIGTITPRMMVNEKSAGSMGSVKEVEPAVTLEPQGPPELQGPRQLPGAPPPSAEIIQFPNPKIEPPSPVVQSTAPNTTEAKVLAEITGKEPSPSPEQGFDAYHGTAHDFTQFDESKIGTGQGANTYGHGLYFAEAKAVGVDYQNREGAFYYKGEKFNGENPEHLAAQMISARGSPEAAASFLEERGAMHAGMGPSYQKAAVLDKAAAQLIRSGTNFAPLERKGNLYSVRIVRPKEHFVDWDKSLSEQSPYVQKAFERMAKSDPGIAQSISDYGFNMGELYRRLEKGHFEEQKRGRLGLDDKRLASEFLRDNGIAGMRYLDQLSRTAGDRVAMLEGFKEDNLKSRTLYEEGRGQAEKSLTMFPDDPNYVASIQKTVDGYNEHIRRLDDKIAEQEGEIAKLVSGEGLTRNVVLFHDKDVEITHLNGEPLKPSAQRAIHEVQAGTASVQDDHGRAIVNGHEVEGISSNDLKTFGPKDAEGVPAAQIIDLAAERRRRDNGYRMNERAMADMGVKDFPETPVTEATAPLREVVKNAFGGQKPPPGVEAAIVGVDRFYRAIRWLFDIRSLADLNPHIERLLEYVAGVEHQSQFATQWQTRAETTWKLAAKLSAEQKTGFNKMVDDYVNRRFMPDLERMRGTVRKPTDIEKKALFDKHGLGQKARDTFDRMVGDVEAFMKDFIATRRAEASLLGQEAFEKKMKELADLETQLLKRPFFPISRFGLYTVRVDGPSGPAFYRTETKAQQNRLIKELKAKGHAADDINPGLLPQSSLPFQGMPKELLETIRREFLPNIPSSIDLANALKQMEYEASPLKGVMQKGAGRSITPGYSPDFIRSYSHFFFHGSRYLARAKYLPDQKRAIAAMREEVILLPPGERVKRLEIAQFISDHYEQMLDPRGDHSIVRGFLFHMILGFRLSSAAANLMQTITSTLPHLMANFGDLQGPKYLAKASTDIRTTYMPREKATRLATDPQSEPAIRALSEMMQRGRIRGALAPELAAASEGNNFMNGLGVGDKMRTWINRYTKLSSGLFEFTEQFDRRVAGMATYYAAMDQPNSKFVQAAVNGDKLLYAELLQKFPDREARAITAAIKMVDRTQGQYSREFRPGYMTGGPVRETVFTFKMYTHRMLWNLWNFPDAAMRSIIIMAGLGGLAGVPGFADLNGILKAIAYNVFGKDFDLEDSVRDVLVHNLGMEGKGIMDDPFTVTKGLASRGYGIPALADWLGEWSGLGKVPIPELDRSAAVGFGNILPVDFGVFNASARKDPMTAFASSVSRGMGALGSYAFNSYKAMMDIHEDWDSFKRWEKMYPTFLANISHAARLYQDEAERSKTGAEIVPYDPHDTEHMMEVLATALGYTPFRVMKEWTRIRAEREGTTYWEVRKNMLLNQFWEAQVNSDGDDKDRVIDAIRKFNHEVAGTDARAYAITGETLRKSIQTRSLTKAKQEAGVPRSTAEVPVVRSIRELFPGSQVETTKVK